jgi:hypothetical protein
VASATDSDNSGTLTSTIDILESAPTFIYRWDGW